MKRRACSPGCEAMGDMKMTIDDGLYYLVEQKPRLAIAK